MRKGLPLGAAVPLVVLFFAFAPGSAEGPGLGCRPVMPTNALAEATLHWANFLPVGTISSDEIGCGAADLLRYLSDESTEGEERVPSRDEEDADVEVDGSEPTVDEFIASYRAYEGFPYNLAARLFSNKDIPALVAALNDESRADSWVYAVSTLGAIGTPEARKALLDFLRKTPNADLTEAQYYAKTDVPIALAWVANKSGDKTALAGLLGCTTEDWWIGQGAGGWATTYNKQKIAGKALMTDLIASCIIGLPLTASAEAAVRLGILKAWAGAENAKAKNVNANSDETAETEKLAEKADKEAQEEVQYLLALYLGKHSGVAPDLAGGQERLVEMLSKVPKSTIAAIEAVNGVALINDQLKLMCSFVLEFSGNLRIYYSERRL